MVLDNKLGITSPTDVQREEERISKIKALELFEKGILDDLDTGKFASLKYIHKYLFEDIYNFAGEIRKVNIAIIMRITIPLKQKIYNPNFY